MLVYERVYIYIYMYMYVDNLTEEKDWDLGLQNGHLNWCKLAQHRIQWLGEWETLVFTITLQIGRFSYTHGRTAKRLETTRMRTQIHQ